jgi:hypothetical protein
MRKLVWLGIVLALLAGCGLIKSSQIEQAVTKALADDSRTTSFTFEVSCDDAGAVTITGELFKPEDIDIVTEIAKSVKGVTNVINNCHVPEPDSGLMQDTVVNTPYL